MMQTILVRFHIAYPLFYIHYDNITKITELLFFKYLLYCFTKKIM